MTIMIHSYQSLKKSSLSSNHHQIQSKNLERSSSPPSRLALDEGL
jgi:hypothetical protein